MKLQKAKFGVSTKEKYIEFELEIKVATDYRFFYAVDQLPKILKELDEAPSGPRVYFDSFHELNRHIQTLIEEYEVTLVDELKAKVILYSVELNEATHRLGQLIDFRWMVVQKLETRRTTKKGQAIDVKYFTEEKRSSDYQKMTNLQSVNTDHELGEYVKEMPWTAEREAWFQEMDRAIMILGERLRVGLNSKPEILARKIDQGAKLLLTASGDE